MSLFYYAMFVDSCQAANALFICYHTFLDNIVDIKEHGMWIILLPSNRQANEKMNYGICPLELTVLGDLQS